MTLSINLQLALEKVSGRRRLRDHLALETCSVSGLNDTPKVIYMARENQSGDLRAALFPNPVIFQLYSYGQVFVQFMVHAKHALLSTGGVEYAKKT